MNATSVKRAFGLAAAAVGTSGAMMLAPTVANAATPHPAHVQTVSNVSKTSGGWWGGCGVSAGGVGFLNLGVRLGVSVGVSAGAGVGS